MKYMSFPGLLERFVDSVGPALFAFDSSYLDRIPCLPCILERIPTDLVLYKQSLTSPRIYDFKFSR